MAYRLAQISDTHLSGDKPLFVASFQRVAEHIAANQPDLVVNTGDLSLDGAARTGDLIEALRLHETLAVSARYIPGNHDIGDNPDVPVHAGGHSISPERRARYLQLFGSDFWYLDVPGWRIVAVNAQLLGSDLPAAGEQLACITGAVSGADDRSIALLVHKPLFHLSASEEAITGRFLNPGPRRQLLGAFGERLPAMVASGHVHQYLSLRSAGSEHVWCPSTAFVIPDAQ